MTRAICELTHLFWKLLKIIDDADSPQLVHKALAASIIESQNCQAAATPVGSDGLSVAAEALLHRKDTSQLEAWWNLQWALDLYILQKEVYCRGCIFIF